MSRLEGITDNNDAATRLSKCQGFTFQADRKQLADNCGEFLYKKLLA
tara:strand:+ start:1873 stop:2013 length:141 start_codon:yes stop_codon:yes gene_type:complete